METLVSPNLSLFAYGATCISRSEFVCLWSHLYFRSEFVFAYGTTCISDEFVFAYGATGISDLSLYLLMEPLVFQI
jgi:hypothetical protein